MVSSRRSQDVLWWSCVALAFWPVAAVALTVEAVSGVLVAACVLLVVLATAFLLRRRWAWWLLLVGSALGAITESAEGGHTHWWAVAINVVHVALLLTPAVRQRIFPEVRPGDSRARPARFFNREDRI